MTQLALLTVPSRPADLVDIARATVKARRAACVAKWSAGIYLVDRPGRRLELRRGGTLLASAARHATDVRPPGALDPAGWMLRTARAWATFAMQDRRKKLARHPENRGPAEKGKAIVSTKGPRRLQMFRGLK